MKAFACVLLALLCAGCAVPQEQASIGIIGGADGRTSIFVAGSFDFIWLAAAVVAAAAVIVWLIRRKK